MNAEKDETAQPQTEIITETGLRPAHPPKTASDRVTKLDEILRRVTDSAYVAEANREKLDKILGENVRIGSTLSGLNNDFALLKADNAELKRMNGSLFREVQEYRYNLERRMQDIERRVWNLEHRVDNIEGGRVANGERPPDDPGTTPER